MNISQILLFCIIAVLPGLFQKVRSWIIFIISIIAIFYVQSALPIRNLDYWLPVSTLTITVIAWIATEPKTDHIDREDLISFILLLFFILIIGLNRYLDPFCCIVPTRPPLWSHVVAGLIFILTLCFTLWRTRNLIASLPTVLSILLVGIFFFLKFNPLSLELSLGLRYLTGQQTTNANALDIRWIGFSYLAFRLIHVLRDRLAGRLDRVSLKELVIYTIFFPTFTAGPIDRMQRFLVDLRKPFSLKNGELGEGGKRIVIGMFKKFVLADSLALIALNDMTALQTNDSGWMWILVYIYSFRIFFDFSGYTDIALGLGRLMGFHLPENFDNPYRKQNLTLFWNSWHITLAQWFRSYFFNPFTRWLRSKPENLPIWSVVLISQISTMVLIGLWHGVTLNFFIWGLWHGLGLFIHNRWSNKHPIQSRDEVHSFFPSKAGSILGTILTFHYVSLGWVWFALSSPELSLQVLGKLIGF